MGEVHLPASGLADEILANYGERKDEFHIVTFSLGEEYGVAISQVHEIVRIEAVTRVPNAPPYMEGVINLRGRILPVLNLRKRLKLPEAALTKESRIVITEIAGKVVGLLVDGVSQVVRVPSDFVENAPEEVLEVDTDYITGVGKIGERLIILLDLEKLLRRDKISVDQ